MDIPVQQYLDGRVTVIEIPERLTADASYDLKRLIKELVDSGKTRIVINLKGTEYMDSSGLGAIVSKIAVARSSGGDIRLACVSKFVADLLELTHIDQILKIFDDIEQAVNSFKD